VDLWLNNPRRGEEACGTSGMKAALNGVLNLSILDGWFDEAFEMSGGWAIGDREPYSEDQDGQHASAIYYLLENDIVPTFYGVRDQTPREWMRRVKQSLRYTSQQFDCRRMVREYMTQLYDPAHQQQLRMRDEAYELTKETSAGSVISGEPVPVPATIELATHQNVGRLSESRPQSQTLGDSAVTEEPVTAALDVISYQIERAAAEQSALAQEVDAFEADLKAWKVWAKSFNPSREERGQS
jgi:hypothetical protein